MIHRHKRITAAKGLLSLCLAFVLLWGLCPFAAAQEEMGAAAAVQVEEPPRDEAPVEGAAAATADTDTPSAEEAASSPQEPAQPPAQASTGEGDGAGETPPEQPSAEEPPAELPSADPAEQPPEEAPEEPEKPTEEMPPQGPEEAAEEEVPQEEEPAAAPEDPAEMSTEPQEEPLLMALAAADVNTVTAGIAANTDIQVDLFNYSAAINPASDSDREYALRFYNVESWPAKDGLGDNAQTYLGKAYQHSKMLETLGGDGYPLYGQRSLRYLFDTSLPAGTAGGYRGAVTHYALSANSGLFRSAGGGYLEYDSARNAAWYDPAANRFILYDGVVRPGHVDASDDALAASDKNFLPFNGASEFLEEPTGQDPRRYVLPEGGVDLWFGMSIAFDFYMPSGGTVNNDAMVFEFMGDDDVWVYIDDVLVLDIGGTHAAQQGTIDFSTGLCRSPQCNGGEEITLKELFSRAGRADDVQWNGDTFADYTRHTFRFFYMERGGNISYCKLRFNLPTLPRQSLTVGKELTADGGELDAFLRDKYAYRFRVLRANSDGTPSQQLYVTPGTTYALLENSVAAGITGTVDAEGYITLKAGQQAQLENMLRFSQEGVYTRYVVEERMPDEVSGQYGEILYSVTGQPGTQQTGENPQTSFTGYDTAALSAGESQVVVYRNTVCTEKLGTLAVTKRAEGPGVPADTVFSIRVTLGGVPLADGFSYRVDGAVRQAENGCVLLKSGETAVITGILAGTAYLVAEPEQPANPQGVFSLESITPGSGKVGVGETVAVTVTNRYTPTLTAVTVTKQVAGGLGDTGKPFRFTCRFTDADGAGQTVIFDLKHGQSRTVENVPVGAVFTVTENEYPGYETSAAINGAAARSGREASLTVETAGGTVAFVNRKDASPDMGVTMTAAPIVPAAAVFSAAGALLLRRRKH